MSVDPAIFRALVDAGCTAEQLVAAYSTAFAEDEARKARAIPWATLRIMAFERDGFRCAYCGGDTGPFEIDHIIPRVRGGENVLENVCVSCRFCNRSKRDRKHPRRK